VRVLGGMATHAPLRVGPEAMVALLLAAVVLGCGPKAGLLEGEAHLGYGDLKHGGLAPLAAVTSEGDEDLREPLLGYLEAALRERHDLRTMAGGEARKAIGAGDHDRLLERYERSGRFDGDDLALLDSLIGSQTRYVAAARVEDESVDQKEESQTDDDSGVTTTTRSAILRIRVAFSVYDLETRQRVWTGTVTGSDHNSVTETDKPKGLVAGILDAIFGGDSHEDPEAPKADGALRKIFATFARELPGG
jgi:hypothetical protein